MGCGGKGTSESCILKVNLCINVHTEIDKIVKFVSKYINNNNNNSFFNYLYGLRGSRFSKLFIPADEPPA